MFEEEIEEPKCLHSGGAQGADTIFEELADEYNLDVRAYSYKTSYHVSNFKYEISQEDYLEGIEEIRKANKYLQRKGMDKYMNLLSRNWTQVKYSEQIFAISNIILPGEYDSRGFVNSTKYEIVEGGTGYACQMSINHKKPLFVFDQNKNTWFRYSYTTNKFIKCDKLPIITKENFTGIGSRKLKSNGIQAIKDLYKRTFEY